jgi:hypothetical protein
MIRIFHTIFLTLTLAAYVLLALASLWRFARDAFSSYLPGGRDQDASKNQALAYQARLALTSQPRRFL